MIWELLLLTCVVAIVALGSWATWKSPAPKRTPAWLRVAAAVVLLVFAWAVFGVLWMQIAMTFIALHLLWMAVRERGEQAGGKPVV
jgi:hypothetical protein